MCVIKALIKKKGKVWIQNCIAQSRMWSFGLSNISPSLISVYAKHDRRNAHLCCPPPQLIQEQTLQYGQYFFIMAGVSVQLLSRSHGSLVSYIVTEEHITVDLPSVMIPETEEIWMTSPQ